MALTSTIYKFHIHLSDFVREHYESLSLTVAQHPSETPERMLARVLAYCLNVQEGLTFTRGLCATEEPDLWVEQAHSKAKLWIEVGEPTAERLKKACRQAEVVKVYSFNAKGAVWWKQNEKELSALPLQVFQLDGKALKDIAQQLHKSVEFTVNIEESSMLLMMGEAQWPIGVSCLK